jgi:predicted unusual protein kinase regulating ubiquinone biosynthesis (AarF/ABC1/UbiB family)
MENISGLKYKDIENMSETIKEEFAYVLNKFGILGILYHSVIHCDLHSGNVFFYINNETTSTNNEVVKYKLGIIDFGICAFPNKKNQNAYYVFLSNIEKLLYTIIQEKDAFNNLNATTKQEFINETIKCFQVNIKDEISTQLLIDASKLFNKYNFNFTEEFNKVILSLHTANNFGKQLSKNFKATQTKIMTDLNKFNNLFSI